MEGKIPSISGLAKTSALTDGVNEIPSVSNLVKKADYDTKIAEIEKKLTDHNYDKYTTTSVFNNLAAGVFDARLKQANLVTKTNFDVKLNSQNQKISSNKSQHFLIENELKQLETFDLDYFMGKSHSINNDGTENYLVF